MPSFEGFRDGEITLGLPTTGNKTSYLITCCLSFPIYKETAPTLYNVKDYMVLSTVPGTQQWYFLFSLSYRLLFCGPTPPNMAHLGALLYATSNPHSRSEREVKNTGKKKIWAQVPDSTTSSSINLTLLSLNCFICKMDSILIPNGTIPNDIVRVNDNKLEIT